MTMFRNVAELVDSSRTRSSKNIRNHDSNKKLKCPGSFP